MAASLARALTVEEVASSILDAVGDALEAATASVWLVGAERTVLRLTFERNADPAAVARFAEIPLDADLPGPNVVAGQDAIFIESRADRDRRWPQLEGTPSPSEALVVLPLLVPDGILGVVSFGFDAARSFTETEREMLLVVADQCAIALDRARMHEAEQRRTAVSDAAAQIAATSPDVSDWTELARHAVRVAADVVAPTCIVHVREGPLLRRVALASSTHPEAERLVDRHPIAISADVPVAAAVRSGRPALVPAVSPAALAEAAPSASSRISLDDQLLGPAWVFPLLRAGEAFGAMTFVFEADAHPPPELASGGERLAEVTAALLTSATLFQDQRDTIDALHDSVLPADVTPVGPYEIGVSYVPVARDGIVGGDWWDAFALPGDLIAFAVGDVAGHGVQAVPLMGQLRNALRAHLLRDADPAAALCALSDFLHWTDPRAHCTAAVAVVHRDTGELTWSSGAHPPPVLHRPDGTTRFLDGRPGPPIGL
ncbi:MAG TPA: GAF domain-containing SpoIIE family protein phosphatase, partial [Acidimicrobiales bacterium]|nr:GAF domain-containing SpoIIE family protein phosphatase [Acidimicrobiales bacterium]